MLASTSISGPRETRFRRRFVVDPNGNVSNDSTKLDVTITQLEAVVEPAGAVVADEADEVAEDDGGSSPASVFFPTGGP